MLKLDNISVTLNEKQILNSVSLQINDGEFLSILGVSGCGKSTLLKTICGFIPHQTGCILNDGISIDNTAIHLRNIVMVFQDLRLFPNMLAWENVAFPLKMQGIDKVARKEMAFELLAQVGLKGFENKKIELLSGGQQQRVALARAFAARPRYLLLDEPFSGLDEEIKIEMRQLLYNLHKRYKISVIFVTHDKQEALMLSDVIAIMEHGEIIQCDTPREVYERPASLRIAQYFGERNLISGVVKSGIFTSGDLKFSTKEVDGEYFACIPYNAVTIGNSGIPFQIKEVTFLGQSNKIVAFHGECKLCFIENLLQQYALEETLFLDINQRAITYFNKI